MSVDAWLKRNPDVENSIPAFTREEPFSNVLMDLKTKGWSVQDDFFQRTLLKR